jgi:4-alpha-glucanotransferase
LSVEHEQDAGPSTHMTLIVSPGECYLPSTVEEQRLWGVAANLYLLRSTHNWGFGDYSDLTSLVQLARRSGADIVGLNPLHAMFLDKPGDASPYSPSDRMLLNILNVDVEAIPELIDCEKAQQLMSSSQFVDRLVSVREASLVQYEEVAGLKLSVLRLIFEHFEEYATAERIEHFTLFHEERRELLDRTCTFQALRWHFATQVPPRPDCRDWPEGYRCAESPDVALFAQSHPDLVRFHLWMQWVADTQLKEASEAAQTMAIGLYRDLAVGAHPAGAEIWSRPEDLVPGADIGAPPDTLTPDGQNWGLPPLHPLHAREHAYSGFIELLRANMRYAGALRIDHAMALKRLYWIPAGNKAADGAYVHYEIDDLIGILTLESQRNRCVVVGEDLGSVPSGFREELAAAKILSYRVLFFEKDEEQFLRPDQYPTLALSVASNHDLPTVQGWWKGSDIDLKDDLALYPNGPSEAREGRAIDRELLARTLRAEKLLDDEPLTEEVYFEGVHRLLGRTNTLICLIPLEDIVQQPEQVNLPSTSDAHPNWRRKLTISLDDETLHHQVARVASWVQEGRLLKTAVRI